LLFFLISPQKKFLPHFQIAITGALSGHKKLLTLNFITDMMNNIKTVTLLHIRKPSNPSHLQE